MLAELVSLNVCMFTQLLYPLLLLPCPTHHDEK